VKYRDRAFVWTWWAGMIRDSFGPHSVFHVARFGSLRIWRARGSGGEARRGRPTADRQPEGVFPLVRTRDCLPLGGLLIRVAE